MQVPYSLAMLWRERNRYWPAILAVAFSAVLIAVQCGVLLGILAIGSRPIDRSRADIWVGSQIDTYGLSPPVPLRWQNRLRRQADVARVEPYIVSFAQWHKPSGGIDQCYVVGTRLDDNAMSTVSDMTIAMRRELGRPAAIAVYGSDTNLLGLLHGQGETTELSRQRVEIIGLMESSDSQAGLMAGVFCSERSARRLLVGRIADHECSYFLLGCTAPADAEKVAQRLRQQFPDMDVLTSAAFSRRTQIYWLTKTKAGLAMTFGAILGLIVGAVITSQTLYAATVASLREYAVLRALGIPSKRLSRLVLVKSWWIAVGGVGLALPMIYVLRSFAVQFGIDVKLPAWLVLATVILTIFMALLSGLSALRSLRLVEPAVLLR